MENKARFKFSLRHSCKYVPLTRAPIFDMHRCSDMAGNKASFGNGSSGAFDDDSPLAAKPEAQGPGPPATCRPYLRVPGPPIGCKKPGSHYHRRLERPTPSACIDYCPNHELRLMLPLDAPLSEHSASFETHTGLRPVLFVDLPPYPSPSRNRAKIIATSSDFASNSLSDPRGG